MSLCVALPASVALFKQESMLTRDQIDPELREINVKTLASSKDQILTNGLKETTSPKDDSPEDSSKETTTPKDGQKTAEEANAPTTTTALKDEKVEFVEEFYFNKGL